MLLVEFVVVAAVNLENKSSAVLDCDADNGIPSHVASDATRSNFCTALAVVGFPAVKNAPNAAAVAAVEALVKKSRRPLLLSLVVVDSNKVVDVGRTNGCDCC